MKITLIQPSENIWIRSRTVPLGLAYLAAVLEKAGHEVKIIDFRVTPGAELEPSDLFGVTATTPLVKQAWEILKKAKEKFNSITVIGGAHASALPDESAALPFINYVVKGEGEQTILSLCAALASSASTESIPGLAYKKEGKVFHTTAKRIDVDLDRLPFPAYHLFPDMKKYYTNPQPLISGLKPAANIITSRGCPFDCVFCFKGVYGRQYRFRSPESVISEWKWLIEKYKVKEISIQDDLFNLKPERAKEICKLIIKERLILPWSTPNGIRADFFDEELASLMKQSGCYRIAFGIESGNQQILDAIGKKIKLSEIEKAVKTAKKYGIKTIGFFVMGNPGDTEATLEETIQFALKTDTDYAQFSAATPFPGTRLFEIVKEKGRLTLNDWSVYSQFDRKPYFELGYISNDLVERMVRKAYKKFYFRPLKLFQLAVNSIRLNNLRDFLSGAFHFFKKKH